MSTPVFAEPAVGVRVVTFGSQERQAAKREISAANRSLDVALRGREWSASALREGVRRIRTDAVLGLYGRVVLHQDRVTTPSGTFALCREITAGVETARVVAAAGRLGAVAVAERGEDPRRLLLYIDGPAGRHLEPCKPEELVKARVFASRVVSAARTREFDVHPELRLRDLAEQYAALDGDGSSVSRALADLRAVEARLAAACALPRRYRSRADPAHLPPLDT
jgi:hypothetical protein